MRPFHLDQSDWTLSAPGNASHALIPEQEIFIGIPHQNCIVSKHPGVSTPDQIPATPDKILLPGVHANGIIQGLEQLVYPVNRSFGFPVFSGFGKKRGLSPFCRLFKPEDIILRSKKLFQVHFARRLRLLPFFEFRQLL